MFDANLTDISLIESAIDWYIDGHGVALAFVIQTWGSSPRPIGSTMIIRDDLLVEGSVSGGCVESTVIEAGIDAIKTNVGQRLDFGVEDETAWNVGLSCGGKITVLVSPLGSGGIDPEMIKGFFADSRARRPAMLCLNVDDGKIVHQPLLQLHNMSFFDEKLNLFYFVHPPLRRIVIVGGVHITQFLAPMAKFVGYDVTVIDPRKVFTAAERFPGIKCIVGWPDEIMPALELDKRTAIVTLTHDTKIDDPSLQAALASDAFYIACLGSRRTHEARRTRLTDAGFEIADLQRLRGPAGLDIGAVTPAEIATSILAEIISVERMPRPS
mgnify:CR=1 FL=1